MIDAQADQAPARPGWVDQAIGWPCSPSPTQRTGESESSKKPQLFLSSQAPPQLPVEYAMWGPRGASIAYVFGANIYYRSRQQRILVQQLSWANCQRLGSPGRLPSLWTWWSLRLEDRASFSMVSQTGSMKKRWHHFWPIFDWFDRQISIFDLIELGGSF